MNDTLAFPKLKMNHKQSNNTVFQKCIVEHKRIAIVFQLRLILFSIFGLILFSIFGRKSG